MITHQEVKHQRFPKHRRKFNHRAPQSNRRWSHLQRKRHQWCNRQGRPRKIRRRNRLQPQRKCRFRNQLQHPRNNQCRSQLWCRHHRHPRCNLANRGQSHYREHQRRHPKQDLATDRHHTMTQTLIYRIATIQLLQHPKDCLLSSEWAGCWSLCNCQNLGRHQSIDQVGHSQAAERVWYLIPLARHAWREMNEDLVELLIYHTANSLRSLEDRVYYLKYNLRSYQRSHCPSQQEP